MAERLTHKQVIEERRRRREEAEAAEKLKRRKRTTGIICGAAGAVLLVAVLALLIFQPWSDGGSDTTDGWLFTHDVSVKHHIEIEVQDYGTIKAELDPTYAPITVDNFLNLAESGFYDGLTFHRIMKGFMIQGGDPMHNGNGGSGLSIKGEFGSNGVENPLSHKRGVLSMARASGNNNSASSQFFIVHEDSTYLDGDYAAFGVVTEGMDVVDKIAEDAIPSDDNGTIPFDKQPVITKITVID